MAILAALVLPYLAVAADTLHPLAVFVVAPLATCGLSSWREGGIVTLLALATAAVVEQLTQNPVEGNALASRLVIIGMAGAFGVVTAAVRRRQEIELEEAAATVALADALQQGLLPVVRHVEGFDLGLRYRSGEERMHIGGDFVGLLPAGEGRLAFIIGDVCGHGPKAASLGASLRSGWRTLVNRELDDPIEWLRTLDEVFLHPLGIAGGHVTACAGIADQRTREVCLVSAGHPWPVVVGPDPRLLEVHAGKPMGLLPDAPASWQITKVVLAPQERLLLYTDGLIEARVSPTSRLRRGHEALLLHLRSRSTDDQDVLLDDVVASMSTEGDGVYDDDVAVLLIGIQPVDVAAEAMVGGAAV